MPKKQQIEFVIKPDGTVEETVTGVTGPDCEIISGTIENALGEITERKQTSEYYNTQHSDNSVVNRS